MSNEFNIAHITSMEFIRGLYNLHAQHRGCVATIGNFDGIHLGHQAIIQQLKFAARSHNLPAVIVTFEPQPQEFFTPDRAPARLMRIREKIEYLGQHYIDRMVCLRFDKMLACLSPEDFVRQILVESLGVKDLAVGDDFRFGKDRRGDFSTLQLLGGRLGFEVECTVTCKVNDRRISSTWVREALAAGDLELAEKLLGRHYSISGRVVHGDKRGRELGYPTINIDLHRLYSPVTGIFATKVYGLGNNAIDAVTNIGTRPMFDGRRVLLEAYLLDFNDNVYGRYIRVELLKQLRKEQTFATIAELRDQIEIDIKQARQFFKENNKNLTIN